MKILIIFSFSLLLTFKLSAQMLYKGSQALDGYSINYEVWNAANHADKFKIIVSVLGNNTDCVTFDADISAFSPDENGESTIKRSSSGCVGDRSFQYESIYTRFKIASNKSKLKSINFYNLKVVRKGQPITGGSIKN